MQSIPDGLAKRDDFEVRTDSKVTALRPDGEKWMVDTAERESIAADAVILATPAAATSQLLSSLCTGAAALLKKITSPHLAVINLLYEGADATKAPRAFGALHSQNGQSELLGVLHESHIFPDRQPDGSLQLRVMLGGALRPEMESYEDNDLIESAVKELQRLHRFSARPLVLGIRRWNSAIPQYELGHARLINDAISAIKGSNMGPLELAGNYLQGVSLSDTATSGRHAGQKILDLLGS
jgi:oxygen-dependent protoporphyrinogen oxidase